MTRWFSVLSCGALLACASADEPSREAGPDDKVEVDGGTGGEEVSDPDETSSLADEPLGSRWEEGRRRALAGCEQTASGSLGGQVYAVNQYDDFGWLVAATSYVGGEVASETATTYERVGGRVVASETVTTSMQPAPGCDEAASEQVVREYDVAQRPVHVQTTSSDGCGDTSKQDVEFEYTVEDDVLIDSLAYVDGEQDTYTTYDKCGMVKKVDGTKYQNHYLGDCVLDYVEYRRFGFEWTYESQRVVLYTVANSDNDTRFTYRNCLDD